MKGCRSFFFYSAVSTTIVTTFVINRWESQYFQRHLRSLHLTQEIRTATYPTVGTPPLKVRVRSAPSPSVSPSPRVVCLDLDGGSSEDEDFRAPHHADTLYQKMDMIPSWDATAILNDDNTRQKSLRSDAVKKKCQLSDPSYQDKISAPSTCDNVHEFEFSLSTFNFLGNGASKAAWSNNALTNDYGGKEHYVMKTAVYGTLSEGGFETEWRRNQRDAIIMERAGRVPSSYESNVLPLYQFCALTNLVPRATNELGRYVRNMGEYMNAKEVYHLVIQAARALYQVHAYKDGKATFVHADVKPSQFLLFEPPTPTRQNLGGSNSDEKDDLDHHRRQLPLLQINDFNRGEYVKVKQQSMNKNNNTVSCPLQEGCNKPDMKATFYRSPEEYNKCTDRSAASDVHSLGNILYYIISNGLRPFYQFNRETNNIAINDYILKGKLPKLPTPVDYKHYKNFTDEQIDFVTRRQEHPLLVVVRDVMKGCWSFDAKNRPTSLEVLQMLERGGQAFYYKYELDDY